MTSIHISYGILIAWSDFCPRRGKLDASKGCQSLRSWAYSSARVLVWIWLLHTEGGHVDWNVIEDLSRQYVLTTFLSLQERTQNKWLYHFCRTFWCFFYSH